MPAKQDELALLGSCHLAQHHRLAHVIQNCQIFHCQLLKNPVCKPGKADNIDIHGAMARMSGYNVLLGLHGKLLRHDQKKLLLRVLHGQADQLVI